MKLWWGQIIEHRMGRTMTAMDNVLFSIFAMNSQSRHCNEASCLKHTRFGRRLVNRVFRLVG